MTKQFVPLQVTTQTKNLVMTHCVKAFLDDNPELEGIKITHDFIIQRIANYYLNEGKL